MQHHLSRHKYILTGMDVSRRDARRYNSRGFPPSFWVRMYRDLSDGLEASWNPILSLGLEGEGYG